MTNSRTKQESKKCGGSEASRERMINRETEADANEMAAATSNMNEKAADNVLAARQSQLAADTATAAHMEEDDADDSDHSNTF